jgi:hypothetical protein
MSYIFISDFKRAQRYFISTNPQPLSTNQIPYILHKLATLASNNPLFFSHENHRNTRALSKRI